MDSFLNNSIPIILWFQSLGDSLLIPMKFFSFLGEEEFYLFILPIIYWGFDASLGLRLGVMVMLTSGINTIFKFALHLPRPYWVSTEVAPLGAHNTFGAPSGHAQNALAIWGLWGSYARKFWVWIVVIITVLGISLSRLYLALHFPFDTVLGWLIAIVLLLSFNRLWEPVGNWAQKQSFTTQIGSALLLSLGILFIGVGVRSLFGDWTLPVAWQQNAARAGGHAPDPYALSGIITSSATLFGLLSGQAWIAQRGGYRVATQIKNRVLQYLVGLVGVAFFYAGLKLFFPADDNFVGYTFRFLRYTLVGFWVTGLAPFTFIKLKLTEDTPQS